MMFSCLKKITLYDVNNVFEISNLKIPSGNDCVLFSFWLCFSFFLNGHYNLGSMTVSDNGA